MWQILLVLLLLAVVPRVLRRLQREQQRSREDNSSSIEDRWREEWRETQAERRRRQQERPQEAAEITEGHGGDEREGEQVASEAEAYPGYGEVPEWESPEPFPRLSEHRRRGGAERRRLKERLRSLSGVRQGMIMKEVLGPPRSLGPLPGEEERHF